MKFLKKVLLCLIIFAVLSSNLAVEFAYAKKTTYYSKLTEEQKKAYKKIKENLQATTKTKKISVSVNTDHKNMLRSVEAVFADMPYFFPGFIQVTYYQKKNKTYLIINEINDKKTIKKIKKITSKLNLEGSNEIETLLNIHDYLIDKVEYDSNFSDRTDNGKFSISGTVLEGKAVCEGYARTFKYLCDLYDIPCVLATGNITDLQYSGAPTRHMWNYVKLNGKWYIIDATWDDYNDPDPAEKYAFFLIGSDSLTRNGNRFTDTHKRDSVFLNFDIKDVKGFSYPEISKTSYFDDKPSYNALIEMGYLQPGAKNPNYDEENIWAPTFTY